MENEIPQYLLKPSDNHNDLVDKRKVKLTFLDKTIMNSASAAKSIYIQAENTSKKDFISEVHPYVKLISLICFASIISVANNLNAQIVATAFIFSLFIVARLKVFAVYKKVFLLAFVFGFLIILPASLNLITPGKIILNLFTLNKPLHFWIYNIPLKIGFTENGIRVVTLVFLRVLNSVSFAMLIVFTTSFPAFIKSFRILGVPYTFLMIISLAYKYIFILSRTIEETYLALKSRLTGNVKNRNIRDLIGGRIFFIFKRSAIIYENTYFAMVSRGYQGKIILQSQKKITIKDIIALFIIIVSGVCILFL